MHTNNENKSSHEQKSKILIPVPAGELIDKITILEIKNARIEDEEQLVNVRHELALLNDVRASSLTLSGKLDELTDGLREVNNQLWIVEDDIRAKELEGSFDETFIKLARSVYKLNDQRAAFKREISLLLGSDVIEEKSYQPTE